MNMERNVAQIALFTALIAALGLIPQLTLAFGVPITAQSLGVMLCGTVLGAKRGGYAALLFVGLVAIGLPLLSGGRGGLGLFNSPTAGFLIGFPVAAFVTGLMMERLCKVSVWWSAGIIALSCTAFVIPLFGLVGFNLLGLLLGLLLAGGVMGLAMVKSRALAVGLAAGAAALIGGIVVLYIFGVAGLAIMLEKSLGEAALLVTAFLPGDAIKAVFAGLITAALYRARPASVMSRS